MSHILSTKSSATTRGIRVEVQSEYVSARSNPILSQYVFAYTVRIINESESTVHLQTRHWVITDGLGKVEEVRGPGVVGEQPTLRPGEGFQYSSGAVLRTQRGKMQGSYQMRAGDGAEFDVKIAPFALEEPYSLN